MIAFVFIGRGRLLLVVVPYTKAKERYFPSPEPGTPDDIELLQEIRDLLVEQGGGPPRPAPPTG